MTKETWTPPEKSGKEWPKHPEGSYRVVLVDALRLGHRLAKGFQGGPSFPQDRVVLLWQTEEIEPESGTRYELATEFTYTDDEKGNLPKLLVKWTGKSIKAAEIPSLIGKSGIGTVVHNTSGDKVYVNLTAVAPLMKGMEGLKPESYSRNEFWDKKKQRYAAEVEAWKQEQLAAEAKKSAPKPAPDFSDVPPAIRVDENDDLPFAPDAGIV